jgi:hypothetical protein
MSRTHPRVFYGWYVVAVLIMAGMPKPAHSR